jgi:hypothetical protein
MTIRKMIKDGGEISSLKSENLIVKENKVYLTRGILTDIREKRGAVPLGELGSIAGLFEWDYKPKKSIKIGNRVVNYSVIEADINDFVQKILQAIGYSNI